MAPIIKKKLPSVPTYSKQNSHKYFDSQKTSDYFLVNAENIDDVLKDLNYRLHGNKYQITQLLKKLVDKPDIELHILLLNQIYYLMIKSMKTDKTLAVHALTLSDKKIIYSSIYSALTDIRLKVSLQIIDKNAEKQFEGFDISKKIMISFKAFNPYINQFIKTGDLYIPPLLAEKTTTPPKTSTAKYDPVTEYREINRDFIKGLNFKIPSSLLPDNRIDSLAKSPKNVNFKKIYDFISEEIKKMLLNNGVAESQIESEKDRMFLSLIIEHKILYIYKRYRTITKNKNRDKDECESENEAKAIAYKEIENLLNQYATMYQTVLELYICENLPAHSNRMSTVERIALLRCVRNKQIQRIQEMRDALSNSPTNTCPASQNSLSRPTGGTEL